MRVAAFAGVLVLLLLDVAAAAGAKDPREVTARAHFAAGRYQEAIELFARVYGEQPDPALLRDIGRCHQALDRYDEAIRSYRAYLDQARDPADRPEIEASIEELRALRAARSADALTVIATPTPPAPVLPAPAPAAAAAPVVCAAAPAPVIVVPMASTVPTPLAPPPAPPPLYRRWWFWAGITAVLVAGTVAAIALGARGERGDCAGEASCIAVGQ